MKTSNSDINKDTVISQNGLRDPNWKPDPEIPLTRNYLGKDIDLIINPNHPGGEAWTTIWEENVDDTRFERKNRIYQLSPTVLLYSRFPKEV
ncbi:MAG: hypothetical protein IPN89_03810 [Saprospiraceae bacterium]|nr:hypothetical protein [Saprospiraceae bacterium]